MLGQVPRTTRSPAAAASPSDRGRPKTQFVDTGSRHSEPAAPPLSSRTSPSNPDRSVRALSDSASAAAASASPCCSSAKTSAFTALSLGTTASTSACSAAFSALASRSRGPGIRSAALMLMWMLRVPSRPFWPTPINEYGATTISSPSAAPRRAVTDWCTELGPWRGPCGCAHVMRRGADVRRSPSTVCSSQPPKAGRSE